MGQTRHAQRQKAFQTLYSLYFTPARTLEELRQRFLSQPEEAVPARRSGAEQAPGAAAGLAWELVRGVWEHTGPIDALIENVANRGMERIGRIEQVILRMASYEMMTTPSSEIKITLSEAVILSREFGDERSRQFINGILNGISRKVQEDKLTLERPA